MKYEKLNKDLIVKLLDFYLLVTFYTSRVIIIGRKYLPEIRGKRDRTFIMVWHGNMFIPIYTLRKGKYSLLIGLHSDAEILNSFTEHLGYSSIRGSSHRRSIGAAIELFKISQKDTIAITPDGPRGPYRKVKKSTVKILQRIGAEIVPIGASSSRKIILKSWDRFEIPLPFSTIKIVIGKPLKADDKTETEDLKKLIEDKINEAQKAAEKVY